MRKLHYMLLALLVSSVCRAQVGDDAKPSVTNVLGAQFPSVDSSSRANFRFTAPDAQKVQVSISGSKYDMTKDKDGVWSVK